MSSPFDYLKVLGTRGLNELRQGLQLTLMYCYISRYLDENVRPINIRVKRSLTRIHCVL